MGVLKNSANYASSAASGFTDKTGEFVLGELTRTKQNVQNVFEMFAETSFPGKDSLNSAAASILGLIDQIMQLQPIAWTKQRLYSLYSMLMRQMEAFLFVLKDIVTPQIAFVYSGMKGSFETVLGFAALYFGKLDDSLVTPIVMATYNGVVTTYTVTTNFAHRQVQWVNDAIVLPVTNAVQDRIVMPIYKRVTGVAQCTTSIAIQAGAMIDNRLSLVSLMMAVVDKTKKIDECVTSGAITNKVVMPTINKVKSLDQSLTSGLGQDLIKGAVDEFQAAKGEAPQLKEALGQLVTMTSPPTLLTSADASVYKKK